MSVTCAQQQSPLVAGGGLRVPTESVDTITPQLLQQPQGMSAAALRDLLPAYFQRQRRRAIACGGVASLCVCAMRCGTVA